VDGSKGGPRPSATMITHRACPAEFSVTSVVSRRAPTAVQGVQRPRPEAPSGRGSSHFAKSQPCEVALGERGLLRSDRDSRSSRLPKQGTSVFGRALGSREGGRTNFRVASGRKKVESSPRGLKGDLAERLRGSDGPEAIDEVSGVAHSLDSPRGLLCGRRRLSAPIICPRPLTGRVKRTDRDS